MDVLAGAIQLICRILNTKETTLHGLFVNADIVTQTPAEEFAVDIEIIRPVSKISQRKGFNLAMTCTFIGSLWVDIGSTASSHDEGSILLPGEQKRSRLQSVKSASPLTDRTG